MTSLNHINLVVPNVPELASFFQTGFNFRLVHQRGLGKFAVLLGEDGFILTLTYDKAVTPSTYPKPFHVGFRVNSADEVQQHHTRLIEAGFDAPNPAIITRPGDQVFGFYANAPGGVLVEVSSRAA
jgi:catechol 2,3-dioxygenase-like lactoylglutathione lyase family enzyme